MPIFEVELDGSESEGGHPSYKEIERNGPITVSADNEAAAKEFAEEHNPGLKAVSAKKLGD